MTRRVLAVLNVAGAALLVFGLTACLDSNDSDSASDSSSWEGPTDGEWGDGISKDSSLIGFGDPWEMDFAKYRIRVVEVPRYGPLSSSGYVDVVGTFEVTKTGETNDGPESQIRWQEGTRPETDDEALPHPNVACENEDLAVGETTTCTGTINTDASFVENSSWRFGMHDVAAFPGQTLKGRPQ